VLAPLQLEPQSAQRARQDLLDVGQAQPQLGGDLPTAQIAAEPQGQYLTVASGEHGQGVRQASPLAGLMRRSHGVAELALFDRQAPLRPVSAPMVDQEIAGDRQQPRRLRGASRVEPRPCPQSPLERRLGQILGQLAVVNPVGEKGVDAPDVFLVDAPEFVRDRSVPCMGLPSLKQRTVRPRSCEPAVAATTG
jgi:hypothetical protein